MEIRKAVIDEIDKVLSIYSEAREFMRMTGNALQWKDGYPCEEIVLDDIKQGNLYVAYEGEEILAVFYYSFSDDETYRQIYNGEWKNSRPYGVIHRIAVSSAAHGRGVAASCFDYAYRNCGNLKIDTHRDNLPMQRALEKTGFEYCGVVYLANGEDRMAFQKE